MQRTKKILATLLPMGLLLMGSVGVAAAANTTYQNPNWNYWNLGSSNQNTNMQSWSTSTQGGNWQNSGTNSGSQNNQNVFSADTFGHNEVPPVPDITPGHITVTANSSSSSSILSYVYTLQNGKGITMAHLHCAAEGDVGPSVVTLYMSLGKDVSGTLASGSISNANILPSAKGCKDTIGHEINNVHDLMQALENGDIYANAHSMDYPDGVTRGQLSSNDRSDSNSNDNSRNDSSHKYTSDNNYWNHYWNDNNDDSDSNWDDNSSWSNDDESDD